MGCSPVDGADEAGAALRAIVCEYGADALSSPALLSNLLADLLPGAARLVRLLVAAAEDHIADKLREYAAQGLDAGTAARLTTSDFANATMFTPEACAWVVGAFAEVLGIPSATGRPPTIVVPDEHASAPGIGAIAGKSVPAGASTVDLGSAAPIPVHPHQGWAKEIIDEALDTARSITDESSKAAAFVSIAAALTLIGPARADRIIADAERLTRSEFHDGSKAVVLANIARVLARTDPGRSRQFADVAERRARQTGLGERRWALAGVAVALLPSDRKRAERIIADVLRARKRRDVVGSDDSGAFFVVVEALAPTDPERAESISTMIANEGVKAAAFAAISVALAHSDQDRAARILADAERIARRITDPYFRAAALAGIANALARENPDRAQGIVAEAECLIVGRSDNSGIIGDLISTAIARSQANVVTGLAPSDPDRASLLARRITDNGSRAVALASVATALIG
jgi:hypothetical protein